VGRRQDIDPGVRLTAPPKSQQIWISAECPLRVGKRTILGWRSNVAYAPKTVVDFRPPKAAFGRIA
jgi:hypothetical protein